MTISIKKSIICTIFAQKKFKIKKITDDVNLQNLMILAETGNPKRDSYYEETFRKILSGKKYVWNWCAALFGPVWFVYRKDYFSYFAIIGFNFAVISWLALQNKTEGQLLIVVMILYVSMFFFSGFVGNNIYLWLLKRKINRKYHRTFHPDIHFNVDYMSAFLVILSPFFGAAPSVVRILFVVLRDGVEVRMDSKKI